MDRQEQEKQEEREDMATIRMKRGIQSDIETMPLLSGEMAVALDTGRVYVGTEEGTVPMMGDGGDMDTSIYDPQKKQQDIFAYIDQKQNTKTVRFIVGTTEAGWTADDCDYLCDGTDDQEEIQAAIAALPVSGGEILLLDGEYHITKIIDVRPSGYSSSEYFKHGITIRGSGVGTVLKWTGASGSSHIMETYEGICTVSDMMFFGDLKAKGLALNTETYVHNLLFYKNITGLTVWGDGRYCIVENNMFFNNTLAVSIAPYANVFTGNLLCDNDSGIDVSGDYNIVEANLVYKYSGSYTSSQFTIKVTKNNSIIIGNIVKGKAPTVSGTGNIVDNNQS